VSDSGGTILPTVVALGPRAAEANLVERARLVHLNQVQLARRWALSPRTLERWRWPQEGPKYVKVGGRVLYRLEDIEAFEEQCMRGQL
jgi:hypothetical protein